VDLSENSDGGFTIGQRIIFRFNPGFKLFQKKAMQSYTRILFGLCCCLFSCLQPPNELEVVENKPMSALVVPSGFKFSTIHNLYLKIGAVDNYQKALKGIPVKIYQLETEDLARDYLSTVWIGEHGVVELPLQLATATQFLVFETDYPGIPSQTIALAPEMESLQIVLGEDNQAKDRSDHALYNPNGLGGIRDRNNTYTYMGSFDQDGVPNYLTPLGESVGQDVLELISANLPEGKSVRNHPAGLLDPAAQNNVVLQQAAEVRVHFIHEGSSMRSALGYYTYTTQYPPQNPAEIGPVTIIYPNLSFPSSGGKLHTGDQVLLGTFPAGTTVAWFLVPDGWKPAELTVKNGTASVIYTDASFNTFVDLAHQKFALTLLSPQKELLLLGFEQDSDEDYNDAVIGIQVAPFSALDQQNVKRADQIQVDQDKDGVPDGFDYAPTDGSYAFKAFSPNENSIGTLVFEDYWPGRGDNDFNDMVVDYQMEERLNTEGKLVEVLMHLKLRAMGASIQNGLGFDLTVPAEKVARVEGSVLSESYIRLNNNGVESGQKRAVVIAFDNAFSILPRPGSGFVNTEKDKPYIGVKDLQLKIVFTEPVERNALGSAPYNPFLIAHGDRGVEIHLPLHPPTDLAQFSLFGTLDDDSIKTRWEIWLRTKFINVITIPEKDILRTQY